MFSPRENILEGIEPPILKERDWQIHSLALDLAGRCNLKCRYCAESAIQPPNRAPMSEDVLDRALDWLTQDKKHMHRSIRLGSGEPMLAKPLLLHLEQRLSHLQTSGCPPPQVFITTNGTLLNNETRDWLVKTGWNIKISLDGPAQIHDRWRVTPFGAPTHQIVSEAVADLSTRMPKRFSVSAVLCRATEPGAVFNGIAKLGVRRIEMVPVDHPDLTILPDINDTNHYRRFVLDYAAQFIDGEKKLPELVRVINASRRVMGYDLKRVVCGAGRTFLGVGSDGRLYPCFRFIGMDEFCLGDLMNGLSPALLGNFRNGAGRPYDQREDCRACWAAPLCGGPCFAVMELMNRSAERPFQRHCDFIRSDAEAAITLVEGLRNRDLERLLCLIEGFVDF
jgi:uncharacterized protein